MYSLHDREKFMIRIVLISTAPFAVLTTIAIIMAVQAAF